jgi:hypothetical protein
MSPTKNNAVVDAVEHLTARTLPWPLEHAAIDAIKHLVARSLPDDTTGTTLENTIMKPASQTETAAVPTVAPEPSRPVLPLSLDVVAMHAVVRAVDASTHTLEGDDPTL